MTPLPFIWNGEAMEIRKGFQRQADAQYVIGEIYRLAPIEDRSEASHRQEFAWLREAWASLPEHLADQFPTSEHLRKRALIATGFCTMADYVCGSRAEAVRWAANLRREADDYTLIVVSESVVRVMKAKSQSRRAMAKDEFQASKDAILQWVGDLIGLAPADLAEQREAA